METQVDIDISKVRPLAYKNTVESLLSSIEKKAEDDPETAEECKSWKSSKFEKS
jgi:hypothetical protein